METNERDWAAERAALRKRMRSGLEAAGFEHMTKLRATLPSCPLVVVYWGVRTTRLDGNSRNPIAGVHLWARVGSSEYEMQHAEERRMYGVSDDCESAWVALWRFLLTDCAGKQALWGRLARDEARRLEIEQVIEAAQARAKTSAELYASGSHNYVGVRTLKLPVEKEALVKALRGLKRLGLIPEA